MHQVGKCFPRSRKIQRLCCLFVVELGITCGVPARRCLAECCEQLVSVAASDLDESGTHGDGEDSPAGYGGTAVGDGGDTSTSSERPTSGESLMEDGVREAACQALAVLAQEPGLARRLVKAGAGYAVTVAMSAGARKYEVQIPCLEIVERLAAVAASMPGTWSNVSFCCTSEHGGTEIRGAGMRMRSKLTLCLLYHPLSFLVRFLYMPVEK